MKKIFCFSLLLVLSGCSTQLKYQMNNAKFLSPEAKGKFFKGEIGLSYQRTHKVVLSEAFDTVIFNLGVVNTNVNNIELGNNISMPIDIGLLEKVDFYTIDSSKYGLKYQFIGDDESKRTEGYKAALALAYGYDHPTSGDLTYTNGSSVRTYSTDMKVKSYESTLILGKRVSETSLVYSTIFYDSYKYDGTLSSNQFSAVRATGKSYNEGILLGAEFSNPKNFFNFKLKVEGGVVKAKLDNLNDRTSGSFGSAVSYFW